MSIPEIKYVSCDDDWVSPDMPTITILEQDDEPIDTGILDENGVRIFRTINRQPIGFCR